MADSISIVLLGTGNLASHLFQALQKALGVRVVQVYGRHRKGFAVFGNQVATTTDYKELLDADLYLIAVSDDAIQSVSQHFTGKRGLVAHTSGGVPMSALKTHRKGVFYPLQSFTAGRPLDFSGVPICLESERKADLALLEKVGQAISKLVYPISSEQRKSLHLAAVFANNFSNYLYSIAEKICWEHQLDFELLVPLIAETANKIRFLSPKEAQTGPARRQDTSTLKAHLELLGDPGDKAIYKRISQAIATTYGKKL
ncbi:MAG: DUF2520 domain-containing protein [Bacteroidota bacterium]